MYSNIDLDHARSVMKGWIESYVPPDRESPLPPTDTILDALDLVMRHNIMQFGDSYFKQLVGTAMGTSSAVTFANLYFGKHEKDTILPTFLENLKRISFYARFVDDVFLIWNGPCDDTWDSLIKTFDDFGILKWETSLPSSSVTFLDLTVTLRESQITTRTFQKENNPYLYIPPHSAHPPGMIDGIIYSLLRTYYHQNSHHSDFLHFAKLLFQRHVSQGWDPKALQKIFAKAWDKLKARNENPAQPSDSTSNEELLFFHMQFHPNDISQRDIRKIYGETCEETFKTEIGINRLIIAYSRPKTIGNVIAKAKLFETEEQKVSRHIAGELPDT
eukprot:CCRYP_014250-RB/>CCRYP_014250-RB protein AED:0.28 eAED:0.14 QI:0/-1/0/1/-1/0/1/0/330